MTEEEQRKELESRHGVVWDDAQLIEVFAVLGYMLPFVILQRRADKVRGAVRAVELGGSRYLYYDWKSDR